MEKIFQPYNINGRLQLKNRLVMAPMTTWSGNEDGCVSDDELAYYEYRSHGVGMVITATTYTVAHGKGFSGQFYAGDDQMLESLTALAHVIHSAGAKAVLQVFHAGRKANPKDMPDGQIVSASAVAPNREPDKIPRAMTQLEIEELIQSFYEVVIRADQAGFDGIEIHGANTYLLQQFFSPHSNRRQDAYGGSLDARMTLPLEIVKSCLKARDQLENKNFIVGYRFSPEENYDPGITLEDTLYLIDHLLEYDLDYLHISLGDYKQTSIRHDYENSTLNHVIDKIDHKMPFIGVGSVYQKEDAMDMLDQGVDLVALGRQLLIDGKTVEKWQENQVAKALYDPLEKGLEKMPLPLHERIMQVDNWVPKK